MSESADPLNKPFGSVFGEQYAIAEYSDRQYRYSGAVSPLEPIPIHPASHVLHYASTCFEGLKAHMQTDGTVAIFRLNDHAKRMTKSIKELHVQPQEIDLIKKMIMDTVAANKHLTPNPPGSLYIRPAFIGTLKNVGAAAAPTDEGKLFVLNSPVGDYFKGGIRPLSLWLETNIPRTTPQFGTIKSGANYAMALGPTLKAKQEHNVDQVLFASDNDVTETGAANFFMVDDEKIVTRKLDNSFLHGITRTSVLQIAADVGYKIEERTITPNEIMQWQGEAFLTGTAAVIAPVGKVISDNGEQIFGDGQPGQNTLKLRETLTNIQIGKEPDVYNWLTKIT